MNTNNNSNTNNRNDDDSKDMSIDIQIETNTNNENNNRIFTISSNKISNKEENDDESCKCGNKELHKDECGLYCGMYPCEDELIKLPKCDHYLHKNCLETLLYTRLSKCPLCRSSIESWRRSKHFQRIEKEIAKQFQTDTEQAILLSQKSLEKEEKRKSRADQQDNRERERSRSRERDRNNERNNHRNGHRNNDNRRVRFRSFFNSNRSRNRNRNNNHNQRHTM